MSEIGMRVRKALSHADMSQKSLAQAAGMTTHALSRALNGRRGFGAAELAEIATALQVDAHYLITGEQDPYALVLSARHDFDSRSFARNVDGLDGDKAVLESIRLAYVQAAL